VTCPLACPGGDRPAARAQDVTVHVVDERGAVGEGGRRCLRRLLELSGLITDRHHGEKHTHLDGTRAASPDLSDGYDISGQSRVYSISCCSLYSLTVVLEF
jgi:hypothetical protein